MRAVIAVALASLIIGGLSGFILGEHTDGNDRHFGPGGFRGGPQGGFPQQGQQPFPGQPMRDARPGELAAPTQPMDPCRRST